MSDPQSGFYFNGTTYTECKLLASYDFNGGKVRLLIGKSKVVIVGKDSFVTQKPTSDFEIKRQAERSKRESERKDFINKVMASIAKGPKTIADLHRETGFGHPALHARLAHWYEFQMLGMDEQQRYYDTRKKTEAA